MITGTSMFDSTSTLDNTSMEINADNACLLLWHLLQSA